MLDHNSFHYGADQIMTVSTSAGGVNRKINDVTVSNNIMGGTIKEGPLTSNRNVDTLNHLSWYRNLLIHYGNRGPELQRSDTTYDTDPAWMKYYVRLVNNYNYGHISRFGNIWGGRDIDFIGNVYECSPSSSCSCSSNRVTNVWRWNDEHYTNNDYVGPATIYEDDNDHVDCDFSGYDFWVEATAGGDYIGQLPDSVKRGAMLGGANIPIFPPTPLASSVVLNSLIGASGQQSGDVGAHKLIDCDGTWLTAKRDSLDQLLISHVRNNTGRPGRSTDDYMSWDEFDASYPSGSACTDTDSDGMPDAFEIAMGESDGTSLSPGADCGGNGYLNIEEWAHGGLTEPGTLTWTDNAENETEYRVYRWQSGSGWTLLATLDPNTESYTVPGGSWAVGDSLRVHAYSTAGGLSDPSNAVEVTCP
jgi:hypothetical protein